MTSLQTDGNPNKGLTDDNDGDLILNESGTSINIGHIDDEEVAVESDARKNIVKDGVVVMQHGQVQNPYDISDKKNSEIPKA